MQKSAELLGEESPKLRCWKYLGHLTDAMAMSVEVAFEL